MVVDESNGEQKMTHKGNKIARWKAEYLGEKSNKNRAKRNDGIQTRYELLATFGDDPTKTLGGARTTKWVAVLLM